MRIELLASLKGKVNGKTVTWPKGRIFDDNVEKIPQDIKAEKELSRGVVKILDGLPVGPVKEVSDIKIDEKPVDSYPGLSSGEQRQAEIDTLWADEPTITSGHIEEVKPGQIIDIGEAIFKSKTDIRKAKIAELAKYLTAKSIDIMGLTRTELIEKAIEAFDRDQI